jgi:subtilisin family serine protease
VHLFGGLLPASGITDERGLATLTLFGDAVQSVTGLYVKPKSDYWTFYQAQPAIETNQTNLVYVRSLSSSFPGFPRQQAMGWGQKAMRLDQLPNSYRGHGIRVAIVDSGAATTHPDLHGIKFGLDIANKKSDPGGWNHDSISHGSHCAGVIAGADNGTGIRGFAPDAEVHVCKQFPGGQISQLIEALEYCIEKQVDLVNLSLSGAEPSEALEQQILRAKRLGVACIVAAGNSGGPVQYPASSPNVLAVAAIGKMAEFPPDSFHAQTVGAIDGTGFFSPKFSCFGPEIAVCAPGVAILSSVPPSNYAVWDGTSMAASHVTGLAALVLAHLPDFQGPFKVRNADRVDRLFQILRASARPVNVGDARRTGFGIPDVLVALGLAPPMQPMPGMFPNAGFFAMNPAAALYGRYPGFARFGGLGFRQPMGFSPNAGGYPHLQVPVGTW